MAKKSDPFSIRLEPRYLEALDQLAKQNGLTRNKVIELILRDQLITTDDLKRVLREIEADSSR